MNFDPVLFSLLFPLFFNFFFSQFYFVGVRGMGAGTSNLSVSDLINFL